MSSIFAFMTGCAVRVFRNGIPYESLDFIWFCDIVHGPVADYAWHGRVGGVEGGVEGRSVFKRIKAQRGIDIRTIECGFA